MDTTIEVSRRTGVGKGDNRKARVRGAIPAVIYGPERSPTSVELDPVKLLEVFKQTQDKNTLLKVKVGDDAPVSCLVREVQRHPVSRALLHVDLYAVPESPIEVMVPLKMVGRPKGSLLGGKVRVIRREVRVACRYDLIPAFIEVDIAPLDIGDSIRASQIPMPEGVKIVLVGDYNVCDLQGKRSDRLDAGEKAEEKKA